MNLLFSLLQLTHTKKSPISLIAFSEFFSGDRLQNVFRVRRTLVPPGVDRRSSVLLGVHSLSVQVGIIRKISEAITFSLDGIV